ncbi:MAG: hypothetical protein HY770_05970 [Chitinivibrionia bacterium]|nr:hypothetical protein [Chitinivibrionia bacterium]
MNIGSRILISAACFGLCGAHASASSAGSDATRLQAKEIRIFGNENIKPYIIERALPFKAGDYFDADMIERARADVRRIPGIDYSEIRVGFVPYDSSTVVSVVVTEKTALTGHLLIGRGYEDKISFGLKALNRNLRGRSETVELQALFRGNTVLQAGWQNPWIGGPLRLGIGIRAYYRKYHYAYDDLGASFEGAEIEASGARLSVSRPLGTFQSVALEGGIETVASPVEGVTLDGERDSYGIAAVVFRRDSREESLFPWNASYIEARAELAGPGDESLSVFEGSIDARAYIGLLSKAALALQGVFRAREGDRIPPYRREQEYRFPFNFSRDEPVELLLIGASLHLFAETAAAWEKDERFSSGMLHGSFGLGISLFAPNSTGFRCDYAWHTKSSGRLDFDVGLRF